MLPKGFGSLPILIAPILTCSGLLIVVYISPPSTTASQEPKMRHNWGRERDAALCLIIRFESEARLVQSLTNL